MRRRCTPGGPASRGHLDPPIHFAGADELAVLHGEGGADDIAVGRIGDASGGEARRTSSVSGEERTASGWGWGLSVGAAIACADTGAAGVEVAGAETKSPRNSINKFICA